MPVKLASNGHDVIPTDRTDRSIGVGSPGVDMSSDVSAREEDATVLSPPTVAEAAALLATIPPFSELSPVERARLAPALEEVAYPEGAVIFPRGATADALYILREGQAQRFVDGVRLDTVRPHSVFGDVELLCSETRSSTLVATPGCVVWRLPADRFQSLLRGTPAVAARFAVTVSTQLADARREVAALAAEVDSLTALLPADARAERVGRRAAVPLEAAKAARPTSRLIQDAFAPARTAWRPSRATIALTLAAVVLAAGWIVPPPPGLSVAAWHALATLVAVVLLYRPRPEDVLSAGAAGAGRQPSRDRGIGGFALQRALLGPPTRQEKVAGAVTLGMLAGFAAQPLHGIDPGWIGVLALGALAIFGVMTAEGLRAVNWSFALLFGVLASMVNVFSAVRLDAWIAGLTAGTMAVLTQTPVLFVAVLTVISLAISFVLRWQAAAPLLTIALTPVAVGAGWDPWIVGLIAILACNAFFLPYQSTIYLALYHGTGGKLFTHAQARPMSLVYAVATLVALCASVPCWQAWGLM